MGFIGSFIRTIFRPDVPSIPAPTVTGRDLVASTNSKDPLPPELGTGRKRKGVDSLLVPNEDLYRGGGM